MTEKLKDEVKQAYIDKIPLKRFAEPIEVAQSVAFLLSDSSSYITGEVLRVNGGMYM
jgi:3-oxoacyl-[acyl-carrier protein] reductase